MNVSELIASVARMRYPSVPRAPKSLIGLFGESLPDGVVPVRQAATRIRYQTSNLDGCLVTDLHHVALLDHLVTNILAVSCLNFSCSSLDGLVGESACGFLYEKPSRFSTLLSVSAPRRISQTSP